MSIRVISRQLIADMQAQAVASPRQRSHFNFHLEPGALVQRLLVQLQRGTYIRPHRHFDLGKWEMTLVLAGEVDIVTFDDDGAVTDRLRLAPVSERMGLELPPQVWHSYVPLSQQATFFEIKEGPYDAARMSQFAPWAPAENAADTASYLAWMTHAEVGQRYG